MKSVMLAVIYTKIYFWELYGYKSTSLNFIIFWCLKLLYSKYKIYESKKVDLLKRMLNEKKS